MIYIYMKKKENIYIEFLNDYFNQYNLFLYFQMHFFMFLIKKI